MQRRKGPLALSVGQAALLAVLGPVPAAYAQTQILPPSGPEILQLSAGEYHTCALLRDGSFQCWGGNGYGQSINTAEAGPYTQISAGYLYNCGLKSDGSAQCWGNNLYGQANPKAGPFTQISAGANDTFAVRTNGNLYWWGMSPSPLVGDPTQDYSPPPVGPFTQVAVSGSHACALTPLAMGTASRPPGAYCWPKGDFYGYSQNLVGSSVALVQVTVGGYNSCALWETGLVDCWGGNIYGQSSPPSDAFLQLSTGYLFSCGLRTDHSVTCWGYNFYGQVSDAPPPTSKFTQVAAGYGHACATDGYTVSCWGRNDQGQATPPLCFGSCVGAPPGSLHPPAFAFQGFYPPLASGQTDPPTLNKVEAGSAVPLKFSLGGYKGLNVIAGGSPASRPLNCDQFEPWGNWEQAQSAGHHGLTYDPQSGSYAYVWKTDPDWAGSCRVLSLKLTDGTEHMAAFEFQ